MSDIFTVSTAFKICNINIDLSKLVNGLYCEHIVTLNRKKKYGLQGFIFTR